MPSLSVCRLVEALPPGGRETVECVGPRRVAGSPIAEPAESSSETPGNPVRVQVEVPLLVRTRGRYTFPAPTSIRPTVSVNCSLEQIRRAPEAAAGADEEACEGEVCAEAVGGFALCDTGRSLRGVVLTDDVTVSEEVVAADEAAATDEADEAGGEDAPSPVSLPQAVAVASAPTSSAHKASGRGGRDRGVVVPFRCTMSDLPRSAICRVTGREGECPDASRPFPLRVSLPRVDGLMSPGTLITLLSHFPFRIVHRKQSRCLVVTKSM